MLHEPQLAPIASGALASLLVFGSANATEYDLGPAAIGVPLSFGGLTAVGSFSDIFSFSMPDNGGSGYSASHFMLLPGLYNTVLQDRGEDEQRALAQRE